MRMLTIEAKSAVILVRVVKFINLINDVSNKFYGSYDLRSEFFSDISDMDIDGFEHFL